jgi:HAD superfamily hydrolase (TIGR01509 family)
MEMGTDRAMSDRAALVDVDGTLVDSNYQHAVAWSRALRDHGENVPLAHIHRALGMGSTQLLERLIGHDDDAIKDSWRSHFDALLPEVVAFDGSGALLRALQARGLAVVLATSSPDDLLEAFREKIGADDAIDAIVTAADVARAKPHPDVFAAARERAGLANDRVVVLGDSIWDVEAARRLDVRCVGLECGGFSGCELEAAGAVNVYRDPTDLAERVASSPFA